MRKFKVTPIVYWSFVVVFFVLATIGYILAGEEWYDATYYAVRFFFIEYETLESTNLLIYICRIACPIMTITGLAAFLGDTFRRVVDYFASRSKNATAVYYDTEQMKELGKQFACPVLMGEKINKRAKSHVLLLSEDLDNLAFYEQMESSLAGGSKVYIKLEEMDSKLLRKSNIYYFNIYEIIARKYWQERNLQKYLTEGGMLNIKIAILGFGALGEKILDYGLMNNIYSLNQSIQYHVWGDGKLYQNMLGNLDAMNGDTITYHQKDWREEIELLKEFDRIIVAQEADVEILQALLYLSSDVEIDFYNPNGTRLDLVYLCDNLTGFGKLQDIVTEENVKTDALYRMAKEVNYEYEVQNCANGEYTWERPDVETVMEEKWAALSGFYKGSNVACADYHQIRLLVMEKLGIDKEQMSKEQEEMLSEMEHVRWSRYHYVNHWHYNEKRNNSKRLHHLLIPYAELSEAEKQKDTDAMRRLLQR